MATAATVKPSPTFRPQPPGTTTTTTATPTSSNNNNNNNNKTTTHVNNNAPAACAGAGASASAGALGGIPRSAHPANYILDPRQHPQQQQQQSVMSNSASNGYSIAAGAASPITATTTAMTASTTVGSPATLSSRPICDACYRRKSRCAMNESVNKCYSCDFHRQDCTFNYSMQAQQVQVQAQAQVQSQLGKRKFQDEFGMGPGADVGEDGGVKRCVLLYREILHISSPFLSDVKNGRLSYI